MDYLERAKKYFKNDYFATKITGIEIREVKPGLGRVSLVLEKKHLNAMNNVMGGVIFTLADFAFAVAANTGEGHTVSLTSQISFMKATRGKELFAEARVIKNGKHTCFYNVEITDDLGEKIASVAISGFMVP